MTVPLHSRPRAAHQARVGAAPGILAALVLGIALAFASYLRLAPALAVDFPLNDGGLFYLMTRELQGAHYALPAFTSYNAAHIPFGYPPLAFYMAGALAQATGWSLLDVMRLLPGVISVVTVPVFALLAWALLNDQVERVAAVFAFALLPRTFTWFIMGGGLTRAPGLVFALLTVHQAYLFYTRREWRFAVTATLAGSLAVASHLENAWFAVYSTALVFAFFGRHRRGAIGSIGIAAGVAVLTAPWWGTVVHYHGWAPFLAAARGGGYSGNFFWTPIKTFNFTDEPYLPVIGVLGLLGVFTAMATGQYFFPVWLVVILAINPRNFATPAMVPLAMLAGIALNRIVVRGVLGARAAPANGTVAAPQPGTHPSRDARIPRLALWGLLGYLAAYTFMSTRSVRNEGGTFIALPAAERRAMQWVSTNTPPESKFLVLAFSPLWFGLDQSSEWFPAIAQRQSVATVQAYEWLPNDQFHRRADVYNALHGCRSRDITCVEQRAVAHGLAFTHVYAKKESCCGSVLASLRASPKYAQVFEDSGAVVFALRNNIIGAAQPRTAAAK